MRELLDNLNSEIIDRFDMLANKNVKYLFYRCYGFLLSKSLPTIPLRHSKLTENKVVAEELQNRYWQKLIENLISSVKNKKNDYLMPLEKKEAKIIIDMKDNYNVISIVYNSVYSSIAEEFKIYLDS